MKPYRLTVDSDLRIKTWSKGLEAARGKGPSAVRGMAYHEVLPKLDHNGTDAVVQVIREGKPIAISAYHVSCFYGTVKGNIMIRPRRNRQGSVTGAEIEFQLQPECTMHRKLRECQPLVDIGKISSSLAHGVRNPLNAIKGAVVYLREKYAHEETLLEFTTMMEEEISRLDRFISSFLSSSLSEFGLTRTDLNALLKKIELFISLQAHAKGIRTVFEYGDILPLMVDPFHMEQAVLNVINNALDAMTRGGKVTVASSLELCAGVESVVIEVSDTGPGLPEAMIGREGVLGKEDGHGFGLFITREVMRFYGGHVEIRSRRGVSTTVRLCLPVVPQKEKA